MRNSVESLLGESYSLNKLHYKKAARVMHCKVLFIEYCVLIQNSHYEGHQATLDHNWICTTDQCAQTLGILSTTISKEANFSVVGVCSQ